MTKLQFTEIDKPRGLALDPLSGTSRYLYSTRPAFVDYLDALASYANEEPFAGNSLEIFDQTRKTWILEKDPREGVFYLDPIYGKDQIYYASLDFSTKKIELFAFNPDGLEERSLKKLDFDPDYYLDFSLIGPELLLYSRTKEDKITIRYPYEEEFTLEDQEYLGYFDGDYLYGGIWHEDDDGDQYAYYESLQIRDTSGQLQFEKQGYLHQTPDGDFILI